MIRDNHNGEPQANQQNPSGGSADGAVSQLGVQTSRNLGERGGTALEVSTTESRIEQKRLVALRTDTYDQNRAMMTAARLVHSTCRIRNFAAVLLCLLVCSVIGLAWLPWQQSAAGTGRVLAYSPGQRPQPITSPVKGVVHAIPELLYEGAFVQEGDLLLEIKPFAADLGEQLDWQRTNLDIKLQASKSKAESYKIIISAQKEARDAAVGAAEQAVLSARAELAAKNDLLVGYEAEADQAQRNYDRQTRLEREGITSTKDLEYRRSERFEKSSKVEAGKNEVKAAEAKVAEKLQERTQKLSEAQAKVDKAEADYQSALGEVAMVEKEIAALQTKRQELDRLEVRAPRDGYIQRLPVFAGGQAVKEGDYLLTFVPKTDDHAVELFILGNDVPLVHPGDHVRLQFEGWPALQFSGWPSVAVGTFGGEVALIDPTDDGTGKFRIMVRPAPGELWPDEAYLRQGVRANGWVMLGTVPLAYEIWRQLNGFPPVLPEGQKLQQDGKDAAKIPKLPK